jgi:hypothetical protein
VLAQRNFAANLVLAQTIFPWLAIYLISTFGGRPLLQDRYLAFSQATWPALVGIAVFGPRLRTPGIAVGGLILLATLAGTAQFVGSLPHGPPGIVAAVDYLDEHSRSGDAVVVDMAPDLNCLRYYLTQTDERILTILVMRRPWPSAGHINHVASLRSDEFLTDIKDLPRQAQQLWFAGEAEKIRGEGNISGWRYIEEVAFEGHGPKAPSYNLRRYARE